MNVKVYSPEFYDELQQTGVSFETEDAKLKKVYADAEAHCLENTQDFWHYKVLIEGSKYIGVWLETQPLGGEMYAKRNVRVALNNILLFMQYQRMDGRLPGTIIRDAGDFTGISANYSYMQGCFLPHAALKMYYIIGKNKAYLEALYQTLERFDDYLWASRDSTGKGCLESWCMWDCGEDNGTVFMLNGTRGHAMSHWASAYPPDHLGLLPFQSPEYMSYSYACRDVLAEISKLLDNGLEASWREKAEYVRQKTIEILWDDQRKACYNINRNGEVIDALTQQNIKCMYAGLFNQQMADDFIAEHLMNPEEFWTPYPLPSIAANNFYFYVNKDCANCADAVRQSGAAAHDIDDNNWSGPAEGLTYQRSISALLNYKHHAEIVLIGKKFLQMIEEQGRFVQGYHPFTGETSKNALDGCGPTVLSALEFISMLYGVNITYETAWWTGVRTPHSYTYTQTMYGKDYCLRCDGNRFSAELDGKCLWTVTTNVRVETDLDGRICAVYGVGTEAEEVVLEYNGCRYTATISPNEQWGFTEDGQFVKLASVPFAYRG